MSDQGEDKLAENSSQSGSDSQGSARSSVDQSGSEEGSGQEINSGEQAGSGTGSGEEQKSSGEESHSEGTESPVHVSAAEAQEPINNAVEEEVVAKFKELLGLLSQLVSAAERCVKADHETYGNLEYIARASRNIAHIIVWTTLEEKNAESVNVPLGSLIEDAKRALETLEYILANMGGLLFSSRRQLLKLEDMLGSVEGAFEEMRSEATRAAGGVAALQLSVSEAVPDVGTGLVDMDAPVTVEGCEERFALLARDSTLFASHLSGNQPKPAEPEPEVPLTISSPPVQASPKPPAASPKPESLKPELMAPPPPKDTLKPPTSARAPDSGLGFIPLFSSRSGHTSVDFDDFPELEIARNCRGVIRSCHVLAQFDYSTYGNLEFMGRVAYNFAAPLLCVRPEQVGRGSMLEEPLSSVLAYTTQAVTLIDQMVERKDGMFSFPKYHLGNLEKVFFKLELLSESMLKEYMEEGELEIRIGSARVQVVNLDEPLVEQGCLDRLARMNANMEVVCQVLGKRRRQYASVGMHDQSDEDEGGSDDGDETESYDSEDGFVDVASIIRSEDGSLVPSYVDTFSTAGEDRWYFLAHQRLAPALTQPAPSSLYVSLRCVHDSVRFLGHHTAAAMPSSIGRGPGDELGALLASHEALHQRLEDCVAKGSAPLSVTIAVCGDKGSGKSSLINAILGYKCLPEGVHAASMKQIPMVVCYGEQVKVSAVLSKGRDVELTEAGLPFWIAEEDATENGDSGVWSHVVVELPHGLLKLGLSIVEVPGWQDWLGTDKRVRSLLAECDIAVVTVDGTEAVSTLMGEDGSSSIPPLPLALFEHLQNELNVKHVSFAVNKMDLIGRQDRQQVKRLFAESIAELHGAARTAAKQASNRAVEESFAQLFGELFPGAAPDTPPTMLSPPAGTVHCAFVSALWAAEERVRPSVEGTKDRIPPPDVAQDMERFQESGLGRLEVKLARAIVVVCFLPKILSEQGQLDQVKWAASLSFASSRLSEALSSADDKDATVGAFEEHRPRLEMGRLATTRLISSLRSRLRVGRLHIHRRAVTAVEGMAARFELRLNATTAQVQGASTALSDSSGSAGKISSFDTPSYVLAQNMITEQSVKHRQLVRSFFLAQWRRWGSIVTSHICQIAASEWCQIVGVGFAAVEAEVAPQLQEVVAGERELVSTLDLPAELAAPHKINLKSSAAFSTEMRSRLIKGVMTDMEDGGYDKWDVFVQETGDPTAGKFGEMFTSVFKGAKDWRSDQVERRAANWVAQNFGPWLRSNKSRLAATVADAVTSSMVAHADTVESRLLCELDHIDAGVEAALGISRDCSDLSEGKKASHDPTRELVALIEKFEERAEWLSKCTMAIVPVPSKSFDQEPPTSDDPPLEQREQEEEETSQDGVVVDIPEQAPPGLTRIVSDSSSRLPALPEDNELEEPAGVLPAHAEEDEEDDYEQLDGRRRRPMSGYFVTLPIDPDAQPDTSEDGEETQQTDRSRVSAPQVGEGEDAGDSDESDGEQVRLVVESEGAAS